MQMRCDVIAHVTARPIKKSPKEIHCRKMRCDVIGLSGPVAPPPPGDRISAKQDGSPHRDERTTQKAVRYPECRAVTSAHAQEPEVLSPKVGDKKGFHHWLTMENRDSAPSNPLTKFYLHAYN